MLTFDKNKKPTIFIGRRWLEKVARAFNRQSQLKEKSYFSLAFISPQAIKQLNKNYRGSNKTTDVLSFSEEKSNFIDPEGSAKYLGEVVICVSQARAQAKELNHSLKKEISRLLVHGLAHLIGYEHERTTKEKSQKMIDFEEGVMEQIFKK